MNMKYCRFQNTLGDLEDCFEAVENDEQLSYEEERAKDEMVDVMIEMLEHLGYEVKYEGGN